MACIVISLLCSMREQTVHKLRRVWTISNNSKIREWKHISKMSDITNITLEEFTGQPDSQTEFLVLICTFLGFIALCAANSCLTWSFKTGWKIDICTFVVLMNQTGCCLHSYCSWGGGGVKADLTYMFLFLFLRYTWDCVTVCKDICCLSVLTHTLWRNRIAAFRLLFPKASN